MSVKLQDDLLSGRWMCHSIRLFENVINSFANNLYQTDFSPNVDLLEVRETDWYIIVDYFTIMNNFVTYYTERQKYNTEFKMQVRLSFLYM